MERRSLQSLVLALSIGSAVIWESVPGRTHLGRWDEQHMGRDAKTIQRKKGGRWTCGRAGDRLCVCLATTFVLPARGVLGLSPFG